MNQYYQGWLEVTSRTDKIHLYLFLAVLTGFIWYKLWLYQHYRLTLTVFLIVVAAAIGEGLLH